MVRRGKQIGEGGECRIYKASHTDKQFIIKDWKYQKDYDYDLLINTHILSQHINRETSYQCICHSATSTSTSTSTSTATSTSNTTNELHQHLRLSLSSYYADTHFCYLFLL
jgi:hypothetical protein